MGMCVRGRYCAAALAASLLVWPWAAWAYNPSAGDYSKAQPGDVRILSYNTQQNFIANSSRDAAFNRILQAIQPDVIIFEEVPVEVTVAQVVTRLNGTLPNPTGSWQTNNGMDDGYSRVVIASRYPLTMKRNDTIPYSSTRGVNLCLVDLPASYATDVYLLGVHLKAGNDTPDDQVKRQRSADAIAAWMGDARRSGGNITLPALTPMIVAGDFNLVGGPQPETTLITGDIVDNSTFGADIKGDWDVSDLLDLRPADPFTGDTDTWSSAYATPASRLDRFIMTDSCITVGPRFVLNTLTMTSTARAAAGLQQNDTTPTSTADHLPIVMDLRIALLTDCNQNGINDATDIAAGTSPDCNNNGIPDECEPDIDGDDIPDACDNCPATYNPLQMNIDADSLGDACDCSNPFADADRDGDVDQTDFGAWQLCTAGMDLPVPEECLCFDRNGDRDIDVADLSVFTSCMSGANEPADTGCDGNP